MSKICIWDTGSQLKHFQKRNHYKSDKIKQRQKGDEKGKIEIFLQKLISLHYNNKNIKIEAFTNINEFLRN